MPEKLLVTASDAAIILSIGKSTFWREVGKGTMPQPVRIGGLTRWRVADLQAFVANAQATTPSK